MRRCESAFLLQRYFVGSCPHGCTNMLVMALKRISQLFPLKCFHLLLHIHKHTIKKKRIPWGGIAIKPSKFLKIYHREFVRANGRIRRKGCRVLNPDITRSVIFQIRIGLYVKKRDFMSVGTISFYEQRFVTDLVKPLSVTLDYFFYVSLKVSKKFVQKHCYCHT